MNDVPTPIDPEAARRPVREAAPAGAPDPGVDVKRLQKEILAELTYSVGRSPETASPRDWFVATAYAVRDRIVDRWIVDHASKENKPEKRVYYLSLEFLIGRLLFDALNNLNLTEVAREALSGLGVDLDRIRTAEPDAALGNGGLGRLAACFMDSMASIGVPAFGYGIRYDHGLFRQGIRDGWQQEYPEDWLSFGNPWEFAHPEIDYPIGFGGYVEQVSEGGVARHVWRPAETVEAVAFDTPVVGWRGRHVNTLRLWSARAGDQIKLEAFNRGDYVGALADRVRVESISRVLYPSDETPAGQELRLRQEYFFVSGSLQDLVRRHLEEWGDLRSLADHVAIQLNDTHPAIAVPELMRLLMDVHGLDWDEAWKVTLATFSYTNHTLLPEALESWPVPLMERLLPRHMQIIYLINALELDAARKRHPGDDGLLASISLIDESNGRRVRMGQLAFTGSHKINGVSALHTELMKQTVFRDLHRLHPDRIVNKTNGITFRRWLSQANPGLTSILIDAVGPEVLDDPMRLEKLAGMATDSGLHERLIDAKRANKVALAKVISDRLDIQVDPDALFDVQIKRIHEYKRQLLNILETVAIYNAMRAQPMRAWMPRVKIFAGKAAASYHQAKLIIKLANDVARVVNSDPTVRGLLKVAFLPNYNVSLAEIIIPAADLSEQISTAGMEASGTGNMKLALNGALTIGTLDGANVEIKEHVGDDNIFIFGLTAQEVEARKRRGYDAHAAVEASSMLREVLESIRNGVFSPDDPNRYRGLIDGLLAHDTFLVTADFDAYFAAQRRVYKLWRDRAAWMKASVVNTARVGWFSSDRTIAEYADDIWGVTPASR
ncbi:alpha-1,4 glucan phosphorylase [Methylopila jiangsuensis]|uniref:Alpha-1,4 glucan phosphorylase n=1 Tax=Methylopila jiangsuensis TaxID=586230 RepID=A0A9W6JI30_9HYPH|nr:glycogen/starch/alpha-glucan phosphorylase [Methylopila jiangsuensis]MDR6284263.1 starch phosphorylase [Methylopila jiangsuensis]GLK76220.1 alpha-1,4 glucan phosphorylase [Methylopila jiangsuensis]